MAKKKPVDIPQPTCACGHELWIHSKPTNGAPWHCTEPGCECKPAQLEAAA